MSEKGRERERASEGYLLVYESEREEVFHLAKLMDSEHGFRQSLTCKGIKVSYKKLESFVRSSRIECIR